MSDRHRTASSISPAEAHERAVAAGPMSSAERAHFAAQIRQRRAQDEYERLQQQWMAQLSLGLADA